MVCTALSALLGVESLFVRPTDTSILLQLKWVHETFCFLETDDQICNDLVPNRILETTMTTNLQASNIH